MIQRKPEDYTSNFMTRQHEPIVDFSNFKKWNYEDVFLFYKGVHIGEGGFECISKQKKWLHTEGTRIDKKFRDKGHGIHLYHHLISTAIRIGCKRLYSSVTLNKYSRRMWETKLSKFYHVHQVFTKAPCGSCGSKHSRILKFYINLDGK
jgi:GNAT superfamily N-acetyltransferase